jgi:UDP-N-acetylmuramate--alanine ligase
MEISDAKKIHFVGVGGIGMSALARLLLHDKKEVSGSDREPTELTQKLQGEGVTFFGTQGKENITNDIDLVIYTEAMPRNHGELVAARAKKIPTVNYFEALGKVANQYYLIAVAGTHGKTTTTAMLTDILEEASFDPTVVVGSLRSKTGLNYRTGKSKYCIVEACEYRRDFLHLNPDILVITNIEAEHLDYFKDLKDVQKAFHELIGKMSEEGIVVANLADSNVLEVVEGIQTNIIDYTKFFDPVLQLKQPGIHNQLNAAAASAVADVLKIEKKFTKEALEHFAGTWRRFEYKGEINGAQIYDDYAHHPTEIKATLDAVREAFPKKKIVLIYQPHLDSRTEKLFPDFVETLSVADHLILNPAYVARSVGGSHDSTKKLAEVIKKKNKKTEYIESFEDIVSRIQEVANGELIVLVMGAGDITKVASMLPE